MVRDRSLPLQPQSPLRSAGVWGALYSKRCESGATAVEFALVAPIFFMLVSVFFELGLIIFTQSLLDNATRNTARLMQVRQIQTGTALRNQVCNDIGSFVDCNGIQYYVQSAASFGAMNASAQTDAAGNMTQNGMFFPGNAGQDVLLQVGYNRPSIIPWAAQYLNGSRLLVTTMAFRNEP